MAIAEISVVPIGSPTASVSEYVARAVDALRKEGDLRYELTPMGTIVEGDLPQILAAAGRMHEATFRGGISRVVTTIRIDDRKDRVVEMGEKLRSVERKLGS